MTVIHLNIGILTFLLEFFAKKKYNLNKKSIMSKHRVLSISPQNDSIPNTIIVQIDLHKPG